MTRSQSSEGDWGQFCNSGRKLKVIGHRRRLQSEPTDVSETVVEVDGSLVEDERWNLNNGAEDFFA